MNYPIKILEIKGKNDDYLKLEITEIFSSINVSGGYDIKCNLEIKVRAYRVIENCYFSDTETLYNFYKELKECYRTLNGKASYEMLYEKELIFNVIFTDGSVLITGVYCENLSIPNSLNFEIYSDQSYFEPVLKDLKKMFDIITYKI